MSGPRVSCSEQSDDGYLCTEPRGHKGDHVALGILSAEGEYARWPNAVERADIPLETYWTDRTAALAEALHEVMDEGCFELAHWENTGSGDPKDHEKSAKDALIYLREHGWTLEREG